MPRWGAGHSVYRPELVLVSEVEILAVGVGEAAPQRVENGGPGAEVPLFDEAGVKVDILVPRRNLPHLQGAGTTWSVVKHFCWWLQEQLGWSRGKLQRKT